MALKLADLAPDFEAESTLGRINFHEWLGESWGLFFSHPEDYTPVCTTELGVVANLEEEFAKRNIKTCLKL
jgi:alkyl hydroperoxide reductase subunit AhpC